MKLWLVGLMGAGKSTVGRRVAERLSTTFGDIDAELAARYGPIEEQFRNQDLFRERERALVEEWARSEHPEVVACGGGSVLHPDARAAMRRSGVVVWLRAGPSILATRADPEGRPLLQHDDPSAVLGDLEQDRRAAYDEAAHVMVDAGRPIEEVVDEVMQACSG